MNLSDPTDAHYSVHGIDISTERVQKTRMDVLNKLETDIRHMRYNSGLEQYPYTEGIEGLRTSLICVLNIMADLVNYLDRPDRPDNPVRRQLP